MFRNNLKLFITAVLLALLCSLFLARTRMNKFNDRNMHETLPGKLSVSRASTSLTNPSLNAKHRRPSSPKFDDAAIYTTSARSRKVESRLGMSPCVPVAGQNCCSLPHCLEYLNDFDRRYIEWCNRNSFRNKTLKMKGACRFMRGEGRAPVALASLPGSGNTWVRGLLEKATGICTGSIYCDRNLRRLTFNAEGVRSNIVLVVKTHRSRIEWTAMDKPQLLSPKQVRIHLQPKFGAVVLLVRNPYHALVADWNRKKNNRNLTAQTLNITKNLASHLGIVDQELFGTNTNWTSFIERMMGIWKNYINNVILGSPPYVPKLVVRYENFQRDRVGEVSRVLDFLHFPYSRETLNQRLEEDFGTFHRNRHTEFEAFTQSQEQFMEHSLREIVDRLSRENNGDTLRIEEYLRHGQQTTTVAS